MTPEIQRFGGIAPEMSPPEAGERLSRDGHLVVRICVDIYCCGRLDRQFPPFCPMLINSGIPRRNRYAPMLVVRSPCHSRGAVLLDTNR